MLELSCVNATEYRLAEGGGEFADALADRLDAEHQMIVGAGDDEGDHINRHPGAGRGLYGYQNSLV